MKDGHTALYGDYVMSSARFPIIWDPCHLGFPGTLTTAHVQLGSSLPSSPLLPGRGALRGRGGPRADAWRLCRARLSVSIASNPFILLKATPPQKKIKINPVCQVLIILGSPSKVVLASRAGEF